MNILLAGASGFIGQVLTRALITNHHHVTALGRDTTKIPRHESTDVTYCNWHDLIHLNANNFDVVINLCGSNIAASRWNDTVKQQLIDSRVQSNQKLINWIITQKAKPRFFCANAVGIYGLQKNGDSSSFDENSPINLEHPSDFLSEIGVLWQSSLKAAIDYGMSVTTLRFGVVLAKNGGMLKKLLPSFYCNLGSIIGDGQQVISWVHMDDVIGAILFLINRSELTGAFNITSPTPVSQAEFARTLAKVMHRMLILKTPAFIIQMMFGEMGESLLLQGQRVLPKRLIESGYLFHYPQLLQALKQEINRPVGK
jgi:hypothetical protein